MTTTLAPFRAVSTLILKSVDDEARVIEGVASSARTDAAGDILEPRGASYALPMPLLMQHDRDRPVGEVRHVKVSDSAIHIRAKLAKDSGLAYVDDAWKQLKAGLVKGLSIGAHPLKAEPILNKDGRMTGVRYTAWRWLELSAVTLPMNSDASIEMVRAFDPWGAEAFARHHGQLIDSIGPAAELADALEPLVLELEAMRGQIDVLRGEPAMLDASDYEAVRARAEAALVASRQVLRSIEPQPRHEASHAVRARAQAVLDLSAKVLDDVARSRPALTASERASYESCRGEAVAALNAADHSHAATRARAMSALYSTPPGARYLAARTRAIAVLTASVNALHRR